jgi:pimeloyl-ACP methyl ester carboxylesterase
MSELHINTRPPRHDGDAQGAVVVLVHGTMDRSTSFTRLAQQLPDWTIVTYDRRGYASSSHRAPTSDFSDQVDDLLEVIGDQPVVAFGHSLGGVVVLAAAWRRPELFRAVVVYEAPAPWEPWWAGSGGTWEHGDPADMAEGFMRRVIGDRIWDRLPSSTREQRRREGSTMVAELIAVAKSPPFVPSEIRVPVIVARGSSATDRHIQAADWMGEQIPSAEIVVVEGADHGAHLSHPAQIADLLRRALTRAETATGPQP